jgi:hypothetical protein
MGLRRILLVEWGGHIDGTKLGNALEREVMIFVLFLV